ncbi:MAG: nucleotidyltransferase [Bacteroidetes bacterium]|nr:nucleotidyltransferase [Bacteroidota bacterium]
MATDKNKHLNEVLNTHKIRKEQALLDKHKSKRDEICEALNEKYGPDIYDPFTSGSYAKNTAVNKKFDFDLMAPFKRNAFGTLEAMYTDVYDFLLDRYGREAHVRKQKVSVGIEFFMDSDGDVVKIDVVPGRELNQDQYKDDNKLNLYVYSQFGKLQSGSDYIRSNIKAQIQNIKDNADKVNLRQKVRLLKIWKIHNTKTPKSFFLELITIKAFEKNNISGDIWDRLKTVLEFIRDNVKTISLPDPGNSNNEVADSMTDYEKMVMSDDMRNMLIRIEEDSDYIKIYFPLNEKFVSDDDGGNKYDTRKAAASIPPATRFG